MRSDLQILFSHHNSHTNSHEKDPDTIQNPVQLILISIFSDTKAFNLIELCPKSYNLENYSPNVENRGCL